MVTSRVQSNFSARMETPSNPQSRQKKKKKKNGFAAEVFLFGRRPVRQHRTMFFFFVCFCFAVVVVIFVFFFGKLI